MATPSVPRAIGEPALAQPPMTAREDSPETREQIVGLIVAEGPITARVLAARLGLTAAGVRRHLTALQGEGAIAEIDVPDSERGRGRPARHYVAAQAAHENLTSEAADLAVEVLGYLRRVGGDGAVEGFAIARVEEFERRYGAEVEAAGDDPRDRARALADALARDGYAATTRPVAGRAAVQLCQGHCPVQEIAAQFPQLCEAETEAFARLLGVHVQRLATLAGGEHVCTTSVPTPGPSPLPMPGATAGPAPGATPRSNPLQTPGPASGAAPATDADPPPRAVGLPAPAVT